MGISGFTKHLTGGKTKSPHFSSVDTIKKAIRRPEENGLAAR